MQKLKEVREHLVSVIIQPFKAKPTAWQTLFVVCGLSLAAILLGTSNDSYAQKSKKESKQIDVDTRDKINSYFFEGISQKNQKNAEAAARAFEKVIALDENNDAAYYELGQIYFGLGNVNRANFYAQKAYDLQPKNEWYITFLAKTEEGLSRFDKAEALYGKLLKLYPEKINFYFDLASMHLFQGEFKEAIKVYDLIESKMGLSEDVSVQKQKIWLKIGNVDKAAAEIQALVDQQPREVRYRMMLADIYLANDLKDKAGKVIREALEIEPDNGYLQLAMAEYYRVNKQPDESFNVLKLAFLNTEITIDQKVRILAPYFANMQDSLSRLRAITLAELITKAHPQEAKAFAIYGDFLYQDKQLEKARAAYEQTLTLDKKVFAVWQNLLFIEAELADYKALLATSNEAQELYPANQLVLYMNAVAKNQTKDFAGAVQTYQQALNILVNNTELEAQIYAGLGDAYHSLNEHSKSDEAYDKALKLRPDDPYVLNNYAYYLSLRAVNLEHAREMSKRSNELLKNNSSFLDTYAWIFFQLKRYDEALVWIEAALLANGDKSATIVAHYGDILFKLGQKDKAIEEWQRALTLGDTSDVLQRKIKDKTYYEK
jgi:tetratricopeptide (TPR) repeat protein